MAINTKVGVALLAAGSSTRFGSDDKLCADFHGAPLATWASSKLAEVEWAQRWVIASGRDHPCEKIWQQHGFEVTVNSRAKEGQSTSVARAANLAKERGCSHLLIALADMPCVPAKHFRDLIEQGVAIGDDALIVSKSDVRRSPPALFGHRHFAALATLDGDAGARALLRQAAPVTCPDRWLSDVDRPKDLK